MLLFKKKNSANNTPIDSKWHMTRKEKPPSNTTVLVAFQTITEDGPTFMYDISYLRNSVSATLGQTKVEWHSNLTRNWLPVDYYQYWQYIEAPEEWDEVASAKTAIKTLDNLRINSKPPEKYSIEYAIDFLQRFTKEEGMK